MPPPASKLRCGVPSTEPGSPRRIVLHVGLHKTGTTFLQTVFETNRDALAEQGIYYPGGPGEPAQRMAAWDLRGRRSPGSKDQRQVGQWDALCAAVAGSSLDTTLISAETLSVLTPKQAAQAVAGFPDSEVSVIVTCRDLGRVLVSAWQEAIKSDLTMTWAEFAAEVSDPAARGRNPARGFWINHDLPTILATWRQVLPAERIHVVTVPPPGAPQEELLARTATVVGFDPTRLTLPTSRDNTSLGVAGTEVVRRLNEGLGHRLNERQHANVVKNTLAPYLAGAGADARYALPGEELAWVEAEAMRQVAAVRSGGYHVVGDLGDLLPRADEGGRARRPDDVSTDELLTMAMLALTAMTERSAKLWWRARKDDRARVAPTGVRSRLTSDWRAAGFRGRRLVASLADHNRFVARIVGVYLRGKERRARGAA